MTTHPSGDTVVLIHGLWMNPLSWEQWEEVADHALAWATEMAAALAVPR